MVHLAVYLVDPEDRTPAGEALGAGQEEEQVKAETAAWPAAWEGVWADVCAFSSLDRGDRRSREGHCRHMRKGGGLGRRYPCKTADFSSVLLLGAMPTRIVPYDCPVLCFFL